MLRACVTVRICVCTCGHTQRQEDRENMPTAMVLNKPFLLYLLMEQGQEHNVEWHVRWEVSLSTVVHMANALTSYLIVSE